MWKCEIKLHNNLFCENHVVPFTVMVLCKNTKWYKYDVKNEIIIKTKEKRKNKGTSEKQVNVGKTNVLWKNKWVSGNHHVDKGKTNEWLKPSELGKNS